MFLNKQQSNIGYLSRSFKRKQHHCCFTWLWSYCSCRWHLFLLTPVTVVSCGDKNTCLFQYIQCVTWSNYMPLNGVTDTNIIYFLYADMWIYWSNALHDSQVKYVMELNVCDQAWEEPCGWRDSTLSFTHMHSKPLTFGQLLMAQRLWACKQSGFHTAHSISLQLQLFILQTSNYLHFIDICSSFPSSVSLLSADEEPSFSPQPIIVQ